MKINLTQKEVQSFTNMCRILGEEVNIDDSKAIDITVFENGDVELRIAEDFITDIFGLVSTMAPLIKGLYSHFQAAFTVFKTLGQALEAKWKSYEAPAAEEASKEVA